MRAIEKMTVNYFRAPQNYFWSYADNGNVLVWKSGTTICYREELVQILQSMQNRPLPPLGPLLLVLAACQDSWKERSYEINLLQGIVKTIQSVAGDSDSDLLEYHSNKAINFLNRINELPLQLRTGVKKQHLIFTLFPDSPFITENAQSILDEFRSGRLDHEILLGHCERHSNGRTAFNDFTYLSGEASKYPTPESLELKLKTNLDEVPQLPELNLPESQPFDLLDELERDEKTAGISRLTKHLIAALHIPMHSMGSSDQPLGGISDITNRGSLDRLLLSELAQDNLLLTARLVNNEALYLRREEPPDHIDRQRIILIDATIKMWGIPRVFAIAAALASTYNTKTKDTSISAYLLRGKDSEEIDLAQKSGVLHYLETLDPSLDFSGSLEEFLAYDFNNVLTELIVISSEENMASREIRRIFSESQHPHLYFISVNRSGELYFNEISNGKNKPLGSSIFDLEEILFSAAPKLKKVTRAIKNLPAFFSADPCPLYYPTTLIKKGERSTFYHTNIGVIGITKTLRLLHWPSRTQGARELMACIEDGEYFFGYDDASNTYMLVNNPAANILKLYIIHSMKSVETRVISNAEKIEKAFFHKNVFYLSMSQSANAGLKSTPEIIGLNCITGQFIKGEILKTADGNNYQKSSGEYKNTSSGNTGSIKKYINNGYSILQKANKIYINHEGYLIIDNYHLNVSEEEKKIEWRLNSAFGIAPEKPDGDLEITSLKENALIKFYKKVWRDGSEAVADSRGMLHLRSSHPSLPEMTIVLALGMPTAFWTSDGEKYGSTYYVEASTKDDEEGLKLFKNYLHQFIDRLK